MTPARAALLQNAVDGQAGEVLTYQPMARADVNARPSPDASRAARAFTGVWVAPSVEADRRPRLDMVEVRQGAARQISAARTFVKLQASALPYSPAVGDRILRNTSSERYEVGSISGDGYGRLLLGLTARGHG